MTSATASEAVSKRDGHAACAFAGAIATESETGSESARASLTEVFMTEDVRPARWVDDESWLNKSSRGLCPSAAGRSRAHWTAQSRHATPRPWRCARCDGIAPVV